MDLNFRLISYLLLLSNCMADYCRAAMCFQKSLDVSAVARPNGQPRQAGVARGVRNFSLSEMRFAAFSGPFGNFFSS